MGCYAAFGLGLRSAIPFPELQEGPKQADVEIRLGRLSEVPSELATDETRLSWPHVGRFVVRRGREIVVDPAAGAQSATLRLFLLGPALAVLLHQRGHLVLHASAVRLDGGAVAFLGRSGSGKSTIAAALYQSGHSLLADDVTAVRIHCTSPVVVAGCPQLKLWPDALAALGESVEGLPRVRPGLGKRARAADAGFDATPLPLRRLYVLADSDAAALVPLEPRDAFLELLRHSYGARTLQGVRTAEHFRQCAQVAAHVPVARLRARRSLAELSALARLIEEDCRHSA